MRPPHDMRASYTTTKLHKMRSSRLSRSIHSNFASHALRRRHSRSRMVLTCWTSYGNLYAHGRFMEMSIGAFYHMRYADIIIFCQRQCITTAKPNFMLNVFGMWGGVAAACRWHERFIIQMKCVCVCPRMKDVLWIKYEPLLLGESQIKK